MRDGGPAEWIGLASSVRLLAPRSYSVSEVESPSEVQNEIPRWKLAIIRPGTGPARGCDRLAVARRGRRVAAHRLSLIEKAQIQLLIEDSRASPVHEDNASDVLRGDGDALDRGQFGLTPAVHERKLRSSDHGFSLVRSMAQKLQFS